MLPFQRTAGVSACHELPEFMEGPMIKFVRVCAGLLLACGVVTAASAQTKWDMPTPYPDGNFHTKNVIQFAADVDKATNGSLKITVHSAGSLIKHAEIKRSIRQGTKSHGARMC